jgi:glycosyltransferase involved in cell wall biosynthesis
MSKLRNNVLMVTEKWCDGTPDLALTNNFHNLFNTFSQTQPDYRFNTIHLDEAGVVYNKPVDGFLVEYCKKWKVDIIIYCLLGGSPLNPSHYTHKALKELGVYQVFMWPDTGPGWGTQTIQELGDLADLHISWDNPRSPYHDTFKYPSNHLQLWVPQDKYLFYKQSEQDIEVSFIGSARYYDRHLFVRHLMSQVPTVVIRGGQREEKLTPEGYAELIRRSKISINFSLSPAQFFQTKGRVFEVLACGSMLLEFKNPATASLLIPDQDFVQFDSPQDLVNKIKYYTEHQDERAKIAEQGWKTYQEKYTSQIFWDTIMTRIQKDLNERETNTINNSASDTAGALEQSV